MALLMSRKAWKFKLESVKLKIANRVIEIRTVFLHTCDPAKLFLCNEAPDYSISITQDEINREIKEYELQCGSNSLKFANAEFIAIHRKLSELLLFDDIIVIHGAAIGFKGQSFVFSGRSGTGKTTHIVNWLHQCPYSFAINGDKPFIKINNDGSALACGSPWAGKEGMYTNTMVPLKAVILMERAEDNHIEQISFAQAFPTLLQQTYRPDDAIKMRKTLHLMQRLSSTVSFWRFRFNNFKDDCFDTAFNALVRNQP